MIQLGETGIWLGRAPVAGLAQATDAYRRGSLAPSGSLDTMMWRSAGMIDADGRVQAGWRKALDCAVEATVGAFVVARRSNVAFTTNLGLSADAVVTNMGRSLLAPDTLTIQAEEPTVEVCVGDRAAVWTLLRRVLPPEEAFRSSGDPLPGTRLTAPPAEREDAMVTVALGRSQRAQVDTVAWFTAGGQLHRLDEAGLWLVHPGDLRSTLLRRLTALAA